MSRKSFGIVSTDDGAFLCVGLEKTTSGWRVSKTRRWNADSRLNNALLLHHGVVAAAPCHWIGSGDERKGPSNFQVRASSAEGPFVPLTNETSISAYSGRLSDNLVAIVCDDAFLCTVPCALDANGARSFVAVYHCGQFYKIGVIINRTLAVVFAMAPSTPESLEGHIGRIKRHWLRRQGENGRRDTDAEFPDRVYVFGDIEIPSSGAPLSVTRLDCGAMEIDVSDKAMLAATGAAFAGTGECGSAPRFPANTEKAAFRVGRTALYAASAALITLTAALLSGLLIFSDALHQRLDRYSREYQQVLLGTPEIASLTARNDSLAAAALAAYSTSSRQTRWTRFLQFLGAEKPDGLFFDMLASDASSSAGTVRMALSGWAYNESLVTGLISLLQKNSACSDVSLTSLEKNNPKNVFLFRVQCSLHFFAGSPEK